MSKKLIKALEKYIDGNFDNMLGDLKTLVSFKSVQSEPQEGMPFGRENYLCLEKALEILQGFGFKTKNLGGYAGTADFGDFEPELGILCHLDVVPEGEGWDSDPYTLDIRDGRAYGRGAIDDKGPCVAAMYAMKALSDLKIPLKKSVRLIVGTNEENGSEDLKYYNSVEKMPPMIFTPDGDYPVINIEKGMTRVDMSVSLENTDIVSICGGTVVNAVAQSARAKVKGVCADEVLKLSDGLCKGAVFSAKNLSDCETEITAEGKSAHASTPEKGVNALTALLKLMSVLPIRNEPIARLSSLFPFGENDGSSASIAAYDQLSGKLTAVLSVAKTDNLTARFKLDIRFPLCRSLKDVTEALKKSCQEKSVSFDGFEGTEPHHVSESSPLVKSLLKVYEEVTGEKGECIAIGGGTYVHETEGGVAFGAEFPGENNNMHSPNEFIKLDSLKKNCLLIACAIAEICG